MKTRTTIKGLFALLARPFLEAFQDERAVWAKRRTITEIVTVTPVAAHAVEIVTPAVSPVVSPTPIELAVAPPAPVEVATVISPAPVPAMVELTATKKVRSPRKPAPVMASAARTTKPRTRKAKVTPAPVEPVKAPEPVEATDNGPSVFGKPFTVRMADTKADSGWSIKFTPIEVDGPTAGVLEITSKRSHAKYSVIEFPTGWEGRGFTLAKLQGGTDQENGDYSVFCSNRGPEADSCDCKGSVRFDHCKHRNALRALLLNDKL